MTIINALEKAAHPTPQYTFSRFPNNMTSAHLPSLNVQKNPPSPPRIFARVLGLSFDGTELELRQRIQGILHCQLQV